MINHVFFFVGAVDPHINNFRERTFIYSDKIIQLADAKNGNNFSLQLTACLLGVICCFCPPYCTRPVESDSILVK